MTLRTVAQQAFLFITNSCTLRKLISVELMMHPTISSSVVTFSCSIFLCIRGFSNESVLCFRWPVYWSFSFSISLSNEYSGLISFSIDWLYLLSVQGTLKSLLQHHKSISSLVLSLLYSPTLTSIHDNWKNHSFD